MSVLYEKIAQLCEDRGINITTLCRESGASRGSLTDLKMGRKQSLSTGTLSKIATYFGVSVSYLLGDGNPTEQPAPTPAEPDPLAGALFAAYGEVKEEFDEDDIADIQAFMRMVAERKRKRAEKAQGEPED